MGNGPNGQRTLSNLPRVGFGTCAAWWLGMSEAPGRRVIAWLNSSDRELRVPSCPAGMTGSNRALIMLSDALRHRRTQRGTRWRRLDAGQQALLVVAHLRTVRATDAGHEQLVAWARRECRHERVWAVEDCRHVSTRLERALLAAGGQVVRVPPKLMAAARSGVRTRGKSDPIDALAVARAALREPDLPAAVHDDVFRELKLLVTSGGLPAAA
ncbi:MAG: transposase [Pseudonocardiales bacterium]|nr:transposase [Pseudonocardiales bacterium]